jgi:DNA polymerase-3 subunit epsilon
MFKKIRNYFFRKNLKDEKYLYLLDDYEGDEYICFDTETTGLNPKIDDIISLSAVKIKNKKVLTSQKLDVLIKPKTEISIESIKIHHILNSDLENALDIDEAIERFINFVGNRPIVGYYLEFDMAMVNKYIKPKLGIKLPNRQIEVSELYYDKKIGKIPQKNVDLRFDSIMEDLNIPFLGKHSSINDAIMTALIFIKLKNF